MAKQLSLICQQAKIVDLENNVVLSYPEAYDPEIYAPVASTASSREYRLATRRRVPKHDEAHPYLICWAHGLTVYLMTRCAPHQMRPEQIEALYYKASPRKPVKLEDSL